jgi:predicted metalloprotease with PDZ domain
MTIAGARVTGMAPNGGRILRSAPGAAITARYRIVSAYAADPSIENSEQPNPVVRPTWFYAVGEALFAVPANRDEDPAGFSWTRTPGIGFASDLEHVTGGDGRGVRRVSDIIESIVIGGRDLKVSTAKAGGATVRVASIGSYDFDIAAFDTLAQKVVATERRFWGDTRSGPFLITLSPVESRPGALSYGGSGRSDAFALWVDRSAPISRLSWLLAHEYFHSWNSRQLGAMGDGDAEPASYWISEGFTDFYARRLMLRAGLMTPQQFADNWNDMLAAYAQSRFRTTPNADAAPQFWKNAEAEKLPYQRGTLLAALWDQRLRETSLGKVNLDTLLIAQRDRIRALRPPYPLITDQFARIATAYGFDIGPDVARYVDRGEAVLLPENAFGPCARVATDERPMFERGYDPGATAKAGNVVTGLDPASSAYAAGLRNGMKLLQRTSGKVGDSRVPFTLRVSDQGAERTITFLPAGKKRLTTQEILLDSAKFAATPEQCRIALAG